MILFGASGHSKVVLDILISNEVKVDFIIDDNPKIEELFGIKVEKNHPVSFSQEAIISIGNNKLRKTISENYFFDYVSAVHPTASVSAFSKIGKGTVVMANVSINPCANIGKHCIINTSSVIEHDCTIEDFVHISPNASLAGNVTVGEGSHIGIGAAVIQGVKIGRWVTIGAGSVIIRDIPDFATVVGNPGKVIKIKELDI